jgi:hypothetical protein
MDIQFFFCTVIMSDYRQGCLTLVCVTTFDTAGGLPFGASDQTSSTLIIRTFW